MAIYNLYNSMVEKLDSKPPISRIGKRIRTIRQEENMSQGELGEKVGLNANRIQQYENGARTPKLELIKNIAEALDVEVEALLDPQPTNYLGAMFALFEMETLYKLRFEQIDGQICICFGESWHDFEVSAMNMSLKAWYERRKQLEIDILNAASQEEREKLLHEYHMWEWNFPNSLSSNDTK